MPRASKYVVLEVVGGMNGGCGPSQFDFVRNMRDGKQENGPPPGAWRVPPRYALVITDVDWMYAHPAGAAAADTRQVLRLFVENLGNGENTVQFESTIMLNSQGEGGISEAMTTGFVVSSMARICPDLMPGPQGPPSGLQHLLLRGFLIPDT